jgi:hypothetical protein
MKKTILFETVDGHDIIIGFDRPTIDPVETNKIVSDAIKETDEYKASEAKKAEYAAVVRELSTLQGKFKKGEKVPSSAQTEWNILLGKSSVFQDDLKQLARDLDDKIIELRHAHAVYFEPRKGEVIKDASEVLTLLQAIKGRSKGSFITLEGKTIEDNRGKVYFRKSSGKWSRTRIVKLGDKIPSNAVTDPDETQQAEIERDRISALPADIKAAEKADAIESAMVSATAMRNELEIKKDTSALKKSQDFYSAEVERIGVLYG